MSTVFVVSFLLLVALIGARHMERMYRKGRIFEGIRLWLDSMTMSTANTIVRWLRCSIEYIHKDMFLNGLHMITYMALIIIRAIERRLEDIAVFLRRFRRRSTEKNLVGKLHTIKREDNDELMNGRDG